MVKLTEENIADVQDNPNKYKGYHFVIDGNDLHDERKSFNTKVGFILMYWRGLPFTVSITSPNKAGKSIQEYYTPLTLNFDKEIK